MYILRTLSYTCCRMIDQKTSVTAMACEKNIKDFLTKSFIVQPIILIRMLSLSLKMNSLVGTNKQGQARLITSKQMHAIVEL